MYGPTPPWVVGLGLLVAPSAGAQQALEIDFERGRTIIDSQFRALGAHLAVVDWDGGVLYAHDAEEPEGIMAFSLDTGEWIQTISTPKGEGPYEFPAGRSGMALAPGGGFYVTGLTEVVEYDAEGTPVNHWKPEAPWTRRVCAFGGVPAVPTQGGVVKRGPGGTSEPVGPVVADGANIRASTADEMESIEWRYVATSRIACLGDWSYVALSYNEGPDTVFAYHSDGEVGRVPVPLESAMPGAKCMLPTGPCPHWSARARLSFDGLGNLVLLGNDMLTHGAIIDPETGCYGLIHSTTLLSHTPVAVRGDSILVFHNPPVESIRDGEPVISTGLGASPKASIHPLRRISGEPCPGMLPTVR